MITIGNSSGVASVTGSGNDAVANNVHLLTGASMGTVMKSLEFISGNESCIVHVIRTDGTESSIEQVASTSYATIEVEMKANDYLVLWEGFFVLPSNHKLYFNATSSSCRAVVNYVALSGQQSSS
jgi:hypothetical protein